MSDIYSNVDASPSPVEALRHQQEVNKWPAIKDYKRRTYELLGDGLILDVGVGPGDDAAAIGVQRCIGFDLSSTMCNAAASLGVQVARSDATRIASRSDAFDGVRADRVLQHLLDPEAAISEMHRITRPGGRLVLSDPDQQSLSIHVPGIRRELTDRVRDLRRDIGYRNGRIAASYPQILHDLGLSDITVDAFVLVLNDPQDAFGIEQWPRIWNEIALATEVEVFL